MKKSETKAENQNQNQTDLEEHSEHRGDLRQQVYIVLTYNMFPKILFCRYSEETTMTDT